MSISGFHLGRTQGQGRYLKLSVVPVYEPCLPATAALKHQGQLFRQPIVAFVLQSWRVAKGDAGFRWVNLDRKQGMQERCWGGNLQGSVITFLEGPQMLNMFFFLLVDQSQESCHEQPDFPWHQGSGSGGERDRRDVEWKAVGVTCLPVYPLLWVQLFGICGEGGGWFYKETCSVGLSSVRKEKKWPTMQL